MDKTTQLSASFRRRGHLTTDVIALNPGAWFGRAWLVGVSSGYDEDLFVIEGDSANDVMDTLAEDEEYGHLIRIAEEDRGDYGYEVHIGDIIGGVDITREGWVNLKGDFITDPQVGRFLSEPMTSGQGVDYDSDCLQTFDKEGEAGLSDIRYHGQYEGDPLPPEGIPVGEFPRWADEPWQVEVWVPEGDVHGFRVVYEGRDEQKARSLFVEHKENGVDATLFRDWSEVEVYEHEEV